MQKLTALFILLSCYYAKGQPLNTSVTTVPSQDSALQDVTLPIYNGRVFYGHLAQEGHAFYLNPDWHTGSVLYDGTWYKGLTLKYDIYRDEVIVLHPNRNAIRLFTERVEQFAVGDHIFVRYVAGRDSSVKTGFYEKLTDGKLTILALRKKFTTETIEDNRVIRGFTSSDSYYAVKDGKFYLVSKLKSLFPLIKEQRQVIVKQLRQQGIKFRHDPQAAITRAAEIYNQSAR